MKRSTIAGTACCLLLLFLAATARAEDKIEAWLDRNQVSLGETVQLSIKADGGIDGEPDTTPLAKDFQVLGTSSSSSINIINGSVSRSTTWQITLQPTKEGELTVPALTIDGRQSTPLTLTVSSSPAPQADAGADIFLETEILPDSPYEQQQVIYQVRLFHGVDIAEGSLSAPQPANTVVQQLGKDRTYATIRNNRHYQIIERTYALFPQQAGSLTIEPPVFEGKVVESGRRRDPFGSFFGNDPFSMMSAPTRPVRITGKKDSLTVRPRPAGVKGGLWLPADSLALTEEWQPERDSFRVGEAITRTITVRAEGQNGAALPELGPSEVKGFKTYPDKAEVQTEEQNGRLTGSSRQKTAFIPVSPGTYTLPQVTLPWWDLKEEKEKVATLPARTITILPGDNRPAPAAVQPEPQQTSSAPAEPPTAGTVETHPAPATSPGTGHRFPWAYLALALGAGWLCTLLLWQRDRRQNKRSAAASSPGSNQAPAAPAAELRRAFLAACEACDAIRARSTLLRWTAALWPDNPPTGLSELAGRLADQEATAEISRLDRYLFSDNPPPWDGIKLASLLKDLAGQEQGATKGKTTLPPLYP
ncbi:MAG: BatD family protein [Desulfobulbaceae bacterium]